MSSDTLISRRSLSVLLAGAVTMALATAAQADDAKKPMEKRYGVSKEGDND